LRELVDKHWYTRLKLFFRRVPLRSFRNLIGTPCDQVGPIVGKETVQHKTTSLAEDVKRQ
jgi:hypothetical protein